MFLAELGRQGILRCLDLPRWVSDALAESGPVPVRGDIGGIAFQSTAMPRGDGLHRLFVHSRIWNALGLVAGDRVEIRLERDPEPVPAMPSELEELLARRQDCAESFSGLSPARQREVIRWVEAARRSETRARRIGELEARLLSDLQPRRPPLLR